MLISGGTGHASLCGKDCGTRWVTLFLGAVATCAAMFPVLVMKVLDLLAFGGLLLMPMGVVIFTDCFVLPRLGFPAEFSQRMLVDSGVMLTNWPAAMAWITTIALTLPPVIVGSFAIFFAPLIGIPVASLVYIGGMYCPLSNASTRKGVGKPVGDAMTV